MKNVQTFLKATLAVYFVAANCFGKDSSNVANTNTVSSNITESDLKAVVAGNSDFAFKLYARLKNNPQATAPSGNLFFSPYSISTAIAMTSAGARGETEKQMTATLCFTLPQQRIPSAFGTMEKQLVQTDKSRGYELLVANALWAQEGEPFLKGFLDVAKKDYNASLSQLDFIGETEKSRQAINLWVEKKTREKIEDLIPQGGISTDTRLVLTNAIYFKGDWKTQFNKQDTKNEDFSISIAEKIKVPMMYLKKELKYLSDEKVQILELPYKGDKLSMLVLLPKETNGLKTIEDTLIPMNLNAWLSKMQVREVHVYLPKFKMTWGTFSLSTALIALGMPDAFNSEKADFSGMDSRKDLFISDVMHKAFVEVNEEGTEAAAATGVGIAATSVELMTVFRADHPFVFIIKDNQSGSILFMGRVVNPTNQ